MSSPSAKSSVAMNIGDSSPAFAAQETPAARGKQAPARCAPTLTKMNPFEINALLHGFACETRFDPAHGAAISPSSSPEGAMRKAEVTRKTAETALSVAARPRRHRPARQPDRRRLLRPHARPARPPRPHRPHDPRHRRPPHRRPPHRRGRRHRPRPRPRAGPRRQARHPPLRRLPPPHGRGPGPRRPRPLRPPLPRLEGRLPHARRSAPSTPSSSASSSPPSP